MIIHLIIYFKKLNRFPKCYELLPAEMSALSAGMRAGATSKGNQNRSSQNFILLSMPD